MQSKMSIHIIYKFAVFPNFFEHKGTNNKNMISSCSFSFGSVVSSGAFRPELDAPLGSDEQNGLFIGILVWLCEVFCVSEAVKLRK